MLVLFLALPAASANISDNLSHWWKFNEDSGPSTDSVGSSDAYWNNSPSPTSLSLGLQDEGALDLDGSSAFLDIQNNISHLDNSYTVSFGFEADTTDATRNLLWIYSNNNIQVRVESDGTLNAYHKDISDTTHGVSSSIQTGVPYYGSLRYDGDELSLWLNGTEQDSVTGVGETIQGDEDGTPYDSIGSRRNGQDRFWDGVVDELSIHDRSLNSSEISDLHSTGLYSTEGSDEPVDGSLSSSILQPGSSHTVDTGNVFDFEVNVSCSDGDCGEVDTFSYFNSSSQGSASDMNLFGSLYDVNTMDRAHDSQAKVKSNGEVYACVPSKNTGYALLNNTDPSNPVVMDTLSAPDGQACNPLEGEGNEDYWLTGDDNGIHVLDASDPNNIEISASADGGDWNNLNGVRQNGSLVWAADKDGYVRFANVTSTTNMDVIGTIDVPSSSVHDVAHWDSGGQAISINVEDDGDGETNDYCKIDYWDEDVGDYNSFPYDYDCYDIDGFDYLNRGEVAEDTGTLYVARNVFDDPGHGFASVDIETDTTLDTIIDDIASVGMAKYPEENPDYIIGVQSKTASTKGVHLVDVSDPSNFSVVSETSPSVNAVHDGDTWTDPESGNDFFTVSVDRLESSEDGMQNYEIVENGSGKIQLEVCPSDNSLCLDSGSQPQTSSLANSSYQPLWSINASDPGNYTLFSESTSNRTGVSNSSSQNVDLTVEDVDVSAPSITIDSPLNQTYNTNSTDLNVTASEAVSTWEYSLDGAANQTFTPNTTLTNLSDGSHTVDVHAEFTDGNTSSDSVTFNVDTDFTPEPEITWFQPPEDNDVFHIEDSPEQSITENTDEADINSVLFNRPEDGNQYVVDETGEAELDIRYSAVRGATGGSSIDLLVDGSTSSGSDDIGDLSFQMDGSTGTTETVVVDGNEHTFEVEDFNGQEDVTFSLDGGTSQTFDEGERISVSEFNEDPSSSADDEGWFLDTTSTQIYMIHYKDNALIEHSLTPGTYDLQLELYDNGQFSDEITVDVLEQGSTTVDFLYQLDQFEDSADTELFVENSSVYSDTVNNESTNHSYSDQYQAGNYSYYATADTSNYSITTDTRDFEVVDYGAPVLEIFDPSEGESFNFETSSVLLNSSADFAQDSTVTTSIEYPNGYSEVLSTGSTSEIAPGLQYEQDYDFDESEKTAGTYTYSIDLQDSNTNHNYTESVDFTLEEEVLEEPELSAISPDDSTITEGNNFDFTWSTETFNTGLENTSLIVEDSSNTEVYNNEVVTNQNENELVESDTPAPSDIVNSPESYTWYLQGDWEEGTVTSNTASFTIQDSTDPPETQEPELTAISPDGESFEEGNAFNFTWSAETFDTNLTNTDLIVEDENESQVYSNEVISNQGENTFVESEVPTAPSEIIDNLGDYTWYLEGDSEEGAVTSNVADFSIVSESPPTLTIDSPIQGQSFNYTTSSVFLDASIDFDADSTVEGQVQYPNNNTYTVFTGSTSEAAPGLDIEQDYEFNESDKSLGEYSFLVELTSDETGNTYTESVDFNLTPSFETGFPTNGSQINTDGEENYTQYFEFNASTEPGSNINLQIKEPGDENFTTVQTLNPESSNQTSYNTTHDFTNISYPNEINNVNESEEYEWRLNFESNQTDEEFNSEAQVFNFTTDIITMASGIMDKIIGFFTDYWIALMQGTGTTGKAFAGLILMLLVGGVGYSLAGRMGAGIGMVTAFLVGTLVGLFPGWLLAMILLIGGVYVIVMKGG